MAEKPTVKKRKDRKVKCPVCNTMNNKEDTIYHNNRYYCKECYEKDRKKTKKNSDGWEELYEYVKCLYGGVTTRMIVQLARYRKEYNFTNIGMKMTLYYYHFTLDKPIDKDTIGLIPYYYERAEKEFVENIRIREHNKSNPLAPTVKRVKVKAESRFKDNKIGGNKQ